MIKQTVSIIIPVYNEAEMIEKVLNDIKLFCDANIEQYEIVCVNDCRVELLHTGVVACFVAALFGLDDELDGCVVVLSGVVLALLIFLVTK